MSLLTDAATEMAVPLLPVFITGVLGAGALTLGWIEGAADAAASILKLVSGRVADRSGKNRPLVIAGYSVSSFIRPFLGAATAAWHVLAIRLVDRVGKGLRTSPRDALIAASVSPNQRGAAYGLHRAMDHVGAVIGPLVAVAILTLWTDDLRIVFWLTVVPGILAVLVLIFGVREARPAEREDPEVEPPSSVPSPPSRALARFLFPLGIFTLGNASDTFLLLKAGALQAPLATLPLLWTGLHVVKALTSLFGGHLADRWGRRRTIALGWSIHIIVYIGFALAESRTAIWSLFLVYGAHHGLSEGAEKALIAEIVPKRRRGTGFGWYHLTTGLLTLLASVIFGALWELFSSGAAFLTSAGLAVVALASLAALSPRGGGRF